jgi:hypothetical protein
MRVVIEIPHPDFKITVYDWNGKYLVKLETAMYEQTYKIRDSDVAGDEDIKHLVADEEFMKSVRERFKEMSRSLGEALQKI